MKERPTFRFSALEPLEARELLSGAPGLGAQLVRARHQAVTVEHRQASAANRALAVKSLHAQGAPAHSFALRRQHAVPQGPVGRSYSLAVANRQARQAAAASNAAAFAAANPTRLAPALAFTPPAVGSSAATTATGPTTTAIPTSRASLAALRAAYGLALTGAAPAATAPAAASTAMPLSGLPVGPGTPDATPAATATAATTTGSTSSSASAANAMVPSAAAVASLKTAVDTFALDYTSGTNPGQDKAALAALASSLGGSAPVAGSAAAAAGLQAGVDAFVKNYTGGADGVKDAAAFGGLNAALSPTIPGVESAAALKLNPSALPAVGGLLSALVNAGTLNADAVKAARTSVANFAAGYTAGSDAAKDKLAFDNLVTGLNSQTAAQWAKAAPVTATVAPVTAASATSTPGATASTGATSTTSAATTATAATATDPTKGAVLFTAVRAPGV